MPLIEWLLKLRHHYSPQLDVRLYPFSFGAEAACDGPLPLHTCGAGALPHVQSFTSRISISVCKDAVLLSLRCGSCPADHCGCKSQADQHQQDIEPFPGRQHPRC